MTVSRGAKLNDTQWRRFLSRLDDINKGMDDLSPYQYNIAKKVTTEQVDRAVTDTFLRLLEERIDWSECDADDDEQIDKEITDIDEADIVRKAMQCHKEALAGVPMKTMQECIHKCYEPTGRKKLTQQCKARLQGPGGDVQWGPACASSQLSDIVTATRPAKIKS